MTYKRLRQVLKEGKKLRAFPLVDNPDSMVLLGSIQRQELVQSISELIGKQRRHEVCMQRYGFKLKQMQLQEQKQMQQRIDEQNRIKQEKEAAAIELEKQKLVKLQQEAEIEKQKLVKLQQEEEERQKKKAAAAEVETQKKLQQETAEEVENQKKSNQLNLADANAKVRRASRFEVKTVITPPEDDNQDTIKEDIPVKQTSKEPESKEGKKQYVREKICIKNIPRYIFFA